MAKTEKINAKPTTQPLLLLIKSSLAGAAFLFALLATSPTLAETQVRLQTLSDQHMITEGYTASVEEWTAASAEHEPDAHTVVITHEHDPKVWVDDVGTSFYADYDNDGYFGGFSLSFDVDTYSGRRDIYAVIYLQLNGRTPAVLHTTEIFTIYSRSGSDNYRVEAELVDNYSAGSYQVQIDIHDAHNDDILDSVGQDSFRNLRNLPLEAEPYRHGSGTTTSAVLITEYAGFSGPALLFMLGMAVLMRRFAGRDGILEGNLNTARARPEDDHYEPVPNTSQTSNRVSF